MVPPVCEVALSWDLAALAPCWCTRAMVESTDTAQSISPLASACTCSAVSTLSQVPSQENPEVPLPHRLPRAELHGQVAPGDPGAQPVDRALDHLPVRCHRPAHRALQRRQDGLDPSPHLVTENS